jgi:hypothetical protein
MSRWANKGHGSRDLDIEIQGVHDTLCTGARAPSDNEAFESILHAQRRCASSRKHQKQTSKEESRLSSTGLEVSPGLTVSREREIRHWRPMIVRDTLLTLTLLTSCLSPHSPDMLAV